MAFVRVRSAVASVAVILASLSAALTADPALAQRALLRPQSLAFEPIGAPIHVSKALLQQQAAARRSGVVRPMPVIVRLHGEPLATYDGRMPGLAATAPRSLGRVRLDLRSAASQRMLSHLRSQHQTFASSVQAAIPSARLGHRYQAVFNGMSLVIPANRLSTLAALPGVAAIYQDRTEQLQTEVSPAFIGAPELWNAVGGRSSAGEGVIVGVLDSGIWPEHPSLRDPDAFGKPYAAPPGPARPCEFNTGSVPGPAFTCNNKLIGARTFMSTYESVVGLAPGEYSSARDANGHGTHTATTAAGNAQVSASIGGRAFGAISGIAPRAHVMVYKVCGEAGCFKSDSVAAVNQAVLDGVDVINFSISGGSVPYTDPVSLAFLQAVEAGVVVAASAGNNGPGPDTTDHLEPWTITVGATTTHRRFQSQVALTATDGASLTLSGSSITAGLPAAPVVVPTDAACLAPFAAGSVTGKIVVCERGGNGRTNKSFNVLQGGAAGMLLVNPPGFADTSTDNHFLPTVHLDQAATSSLRAFLAARVGVRASLGAAQAVVQDGDLMAAFSSRGGPARTLGIAKPDLTAPGVQILAGGTPASDNATSQVTGELFMAIQGTSMASPHVAGAAALLRQLRPTWTPAQIKSALMTTAKTDVRLEDGRTPGSPFDRGSGRIDLKRAANAGLLFDETAANYVALQSSLWQANYPSLAVPGFVGQATVSRTVQNTRNAPAEWSLVVSGPRDLKVTVPAQISVPPLGRATFSIALDGRNLPIGSVRHATLELRKSGEETLRFPITVIRSAPTVSLAHACTPPSIARGAVVDCSISISNLVNGSANVAMSLALPGTWLDLVPGSVVNATPQGNGLSFSGMMAGPSDGNIQIGAGASPGGGYLPLSNFGNSSAVDLADESIVNFSVPGFRFGGVTYTRIGIASNGYVVLGGGTGADVDYVNQSMPTAAAPNNVLAPFWTDLDPSLGGQVLANILSDGVDSWFVADWDAVPEYGSDTRKASFQVWIRLGTVEDVTFAYGSMTSRGVEGALTVGAESPHGTKGANHYFNGQGTLPVNGTQLRVTAAPPNPPEVRTIRYSARGRSAGSWSSCALMNSSAYFGTQVACVGGSVSSVPRVLPGAGSSPQGGSP